MIDVVGVPAAGPDEAARHLLAQAEVIIGGKRHLSMITDLPRVEGEVSEQAELITWPTPLKEQLPTLLESVAGRRTVVLASGDPMVSGIGSTLVDLLGPDAVTGGRLRIHPAVSSVALARARMGWSAESCDVVTLVGRDPARLRRFLSPGNRVIVLSSGPDTPATVAQILTDSGLGESRLVLLSDLGAPTEDRLDTVAHQWVDTGAGHPMDTGAGQGDETRVPALHLICLEVQGSHVAASLAPGLPDAAFDHDGQLTKRHVRACALAALRPCPGDLLWDIGAGAGSVGIEWARLDPRNSVVAVEQAPDRAQRIRTNAAHLGVPDLHVVQAEARDVVQAGTRDAAGQHPLPPPDAVFIGGGATAEVVDACWDALGPGGRLVVHTVTIETEQVVIRAWRRYGGELTRLAVETAAPIGRFTGWTPARHVVQWAVTKDEPTDFGARDADTDPSAHGAGTVPGQAPAQFQEDT